MMHFLKALFVFCATAFACTFLVSLPDVENAARAVRKEVLCGRYCAPTVAYEFESGERQDRVYSLGEYDRIEVGASYTLKSPNERSIFYYVLRIISFGVALWALICAGLYKLFDLTK